MMMNSDFRKDGLSFVATTEHLEGLLCENLWTPVEDFLAHPGKNIRSRLVEIGYQLAIAPAAIGEDQIENLRKASQIVECVHAGALIIDDIQDGSLVRRQRQSMHVKYGVPLALNAGNWLYFWAMDRMKALTVAPDVRLSLMDDCLNLMLEAHYGQAIDLGATLESLDQKEIASICRSSMELKTSSLMALALRLGSAVGGNLHFDTKLRELGRHLGFVLQAYDDVGNFLLKPNNEPSKRWEDLVLKRPSWIWMQVATQASPEEFKNFISAVNELPHEEALHQFSRSFHLEVRILESAKAELNKLVQFCDTNWSESHEEVKSKILSIAHQLEKAYVTV